MKRYLILSFYITALVIQLCQPGDSGAEIAPANYSAKNIVVTALLNPKTKIVIARAQQLDKESVQKLIISGQTQVDTAPAYALLQNNSFKYMRLVGKLYPSTESIAKTFYVVGTGARLNISNFPLPAEKKDPAQPISAYIYPNLGAQNSDFLLLLSAVDLDNDALPGGATVNTNLKTLQARGAFNSTNLFKLSVEDISAFKFEDDKSRKYTGELRVPRGFERDVTLLALTIKSKGVGGVAALKTSMQTKLGQEVIDQLASLKGSGS